MNGRYSTVDEYIEASPADVRAALQQMRETIRRAAPGAEEVISYQMPAFRLNGILVYYAAHPKHVGFYPTSSGIEAFREELASYKTSKGAVQFPLGKPMPLDLVERIVAFRVSENLKKSVKKERRRGEA